MNKFLRNFLNYCFVIFVLFLSSCAVISEQKTKDDIIQKLSNKELLTKIDENKINYHTFSAKLSVKSKIDKETNSFTVKVRILKDSIIWLHVSALKLELYRVKITPDSVFLIDWFNDKYFAGTFEYINKSLKYDFNYNLLQEMLVASPYFIFNKDIYEVENDKNNYVFSSLKRNDMKKVIEDKVDLLLQKISINPKNFRVSEVTINEFKKNRKFLAEYKDFEDFDGITFPETHFYEIKNRVDENNNNKTLKFYITYMKIEIDKENSFPFKIPDNYERIY